MTLLAEPSTQAVPDPAQPDRAGRWRRNADVAALLLALAVLLGPVVHGGGGRDRHLLVLALVALAPAVLLGRVWRLGPREVALALAPGAGAVVVCLTAPSGWAGAADVARFLYVGLLWLAVRAIATSAERRLAILVAVVLGGLYQFDQAYLPWWGRGDAGYAMSGTFFAPNVFGGFMAGAGLAAVAVAALAPRRVQLLGIALAPFCLAGVAYSSSRATIALTVLALLLVGVLLAAHRAWPALARWGVVAVLTVGLTTLLGSSFLMANSGGALSGAARKSQSSSETLSSSGGVRAQWWQAAVHVGAEHPLSGAGFGTFGAAESPYQPADAERSTYAHNLVLQSWAEGGLALALPVVLALLSVLVGLVRRVRGADAAVVAAVAGGGVMAVHAMLDFDAQYPAALALAVVLLAVGLSLPRATARPVPRRRGVAVVVLVALVAGALAAARFDAADARIRRGQVSGGAWTGASGPLRDARFDVLRLQRGEHDTGLLARTARLQDDSATVTWERAEALVAAGRPGEARALADRAWQARRANQPGQVTGYARVLAALGDRSTAASAVADAYRGAVRRSTSGHEPLQLLDALASLGYADAALCLAPDLPPTLRASVTAEPPNDCTTALAALAAPAGTNSRNPR